MRSSDLVIHDSLTLKWRQLLNTTTSRIDRHVVSLPMKMKLCRARYEAASCRFCLRARHTLAWPTPPGAASRFVTDGASGETNKQCKCFSFFSFVNRHWPPRQTCGSFSLVLDDRTDDRTSSLLRSSSCRHTAVLCQPHVSLQIALVFPREYCFNRQISVSYLVFFISFFYSSLLLYPLPGLPLVPPP